MPKCGCNKVAKYGCCPVNVLRIFPVNVLRIFRTHFPKNTYGGLHLKYGGIVFFNQLLGSFQNIITFRENYFMFSEFH